MALDSVQHALTRMTEDETAGDWMLVALDGSRRLTGIAPRLEPWFEAAFGPAPTREVLRWVAAGKTNSQIAEIVSASPRTIGKHLENVYAKLGVETRTAAVNRGLG